MMLTTLPPPRRGASAAPRLHEQERRARVDREQAVPQLDARVVERAAAAQPGGVDEPVEAPEARLARRGRSRGTRPRRRARPATNTSRRARLARTASPRSRVAARRRRCPRRRARRRGARSRRRAPGCAPVTTTTLPSSRGRRTVAHAPPPRSAPDGPRAATARPPGRSPAARARRRRPTGGVAPARDRARRTPPTRAGSSGCSARGRSTAASRRACRRAVRTIAVCASGFSDAAMPAEPKTSTRWS